MRDFSKYRGLRERYPDAFNFFPNSEFKNLEKELVATSYLDLCLRKGEWLTEKMPLLDLLDAASERYPGAFQMFFEGYMLALKEMTNEGYFLCTLSNDVMFEATDKLLDFCENNFEEHLSLEKSFESCK